MKRQMLIFLVASISAIYGFSQKQKTIDWKKLNVLVYSKNGKGYVHDNIPSAVAGLQDLGKKYGFKVDTSTNPSVFKKENLSKYQLLIFPSTNNEVFDTEEQRLAFRQYIEAGGRPGWYSFGNSHRTRLDMVQAVHRRHLFMARTFSKVQSAGCRQKSPFGSRYANSLGR